MSMDPSLPCLVVSPIGDIDPGIAEVLALRLPEILSLPVRVIPLLETIDFAFDSERTQYYSTLVLEHLARACPAQGVKVLGLTREDLFIPILTHVYGEAQLGGRAAVISVSRLFREMAGPETGLDRVVKEAVHELGHSFDLRHCRDPFCVMHYCRRIGEVDQKSARFCRYCRILLQDQLKVLFQAQQGTGRLTGPEGE